MRWFYLGIFNCFQQIYLSPRSVSSLFREQLLTHTCWSNVYKSYTHTCAYTYTRTHAHTRAYTPTHTIIKQDGRTCMSKHTPTFTHTHRLACNNINTHTQSYLHAKTQTHYAHTHTRHTHTKHVHAQTLPCCPLWSGHISQSQWSQMPPKYKLIE